jgi:hypothetical protein
VMNWKIKTSLVAASMLSVLAGSTARAQQPAAPPGELETLRRMVEEVISQNEELRKRIRELEGAVTKQEQATKDAAKEAAKALAAAPTAPPARGKGLLDKLQLGGAIEVEARSRRGSRVDPSTTTRETGPRSDFSLTTAEFDFESDIVDWAKAELAIEWAPDTDTFGVNEALLTIGKPEKFPVYLKGGRGVVPFGISTGGTVAAKLEETLTLRGALTVETFESKEDYVLLGARAYGFRAGAYIFNGDTNKLGDITAGGVAGAARSKRLEHHGFTVGYELNTETLSLNAGLDWIDSVFDADGLFDTSAFLPTQINRRGREYTPGVAGHVRLGLWGFSLVTEYNAAYRRHMDVVPTSGPLAQKTFRVLPQAWQVEFGYTTELLGKKTYGAFNYSETSGLLGVLPKQRYIGTVGTWLADNIRLAVEYANEQDYPKLQRGTNRDADLWTMQFLYEW